jgi:DNA-directed RNA polymerase subunit RPC12/RpoP|tara:strand:- start:419 stop:616 length:198 start_codon:yes stop_codon:yes gene_type:complete
MNLNLDNATDISCDECGSTAFVQVFLIKRISPLVSPNGQEMMVPLPLFKCSSCEHINESFIENSS